MRLAIGLALAAIFRAGAGGVAPGVSTEVVAYSFDSYTVFIPSSSIHGTPFG
jgi:hypothetical protein